MERVMVTLLLALALGVAAPARADSDDWRPARGRWTHFDTTLEVTYAALHIADWAQTLHLVRDRSGPGERNAVLGHRPAEHSVHTYFALTLVGHIAIARLLPQPWRAAWQGTWILVETSEVHRNHTLGVRFALP